MFHIVDWKVYSLQMIPFKIKLLIVLSRGIISMNFKPEFSDGKNDITEQNDDPGEDKKSEAEKREYFPKIFEETALESYNESADSYQSLFENKNKY